MYKLPIEKSKGPWKKGKKISLPGRYIQTNQIKSYKGYKFGFEEVVEDDNVKVWHYAEKDGKQTYIDVSPYENLDQETFEAWIDAGMPKREDLNQHSPLEKEDILKLNV